MVSYVDHESDTRQLETVSSSHSESFMRKHDIQTKYYIHLEVSNLLYICIKF